MNIISVVAVDVVVVNMMNMHTGPSHMALRVSSSFSFKKANDIIASTPMSVNWITKRMFSLPYVAQQ